MSSFNVNIPSCLTRASDKANLSILVSNEHKSAAAAANRVSLAYLSIFTRSQH